MKGNDVVVTAVAGAGKSTLMLHTCVQFKDDTVVIIAYNAPLAAEMNAMLEKNELHNAKAYTFHSLASRVFGLCPDDNTLFDFVVRAKNDPRSVDLSAIGTPRLLLLDEMQDMRDIFWELLNVVYDIRNTQTMLCGDPEQMLYDFEEDDPARIDYLQNPQKYFRNDVEWVHTRLSVSYRLTPPVVQLVNVVKEGCAVTAGNTTPNPPLPDIVTCGTMEWSKQVVLIVQSMFNNFNADKIAIMMKSVKPTHPSVRKLVNTITHEKIPVHVHGYDSHSSAVSAGKVMICTYYAAKGLTFDACITIGASETSDGNPMYVAVSRSRCRQVLILDQKRPPRNILNALATKTLNCNVCQRTRAFVKYGYKDPEETISLPASQDLTQWAPRGRAPKLHEDVMVEKIEHTARVFTPLPSEIKVTLSSGFVEEVSEVYLIAALCSIEYERTGVCRRLRQLTKPVVVESSEHLKRMRSGDSTRMIVANSGSQDEIFPHKLRKFLNEALDHAEECVRWCAVALASLSYASYHHLAERLMKDFEWVDAGIFHEFRHNISTYCVNTPECNTEFDVMLHRVGKTTLSRYRCHFKKGRESWLVVFEDQILAGTKIRACIPGALSDEVDHCCVLNCRTMEVQKYHLLDDTNFLERMQAV